MALNQGSAFAMMSDYDALEGGVNPLLGFASGGSFASLSYKLGKKITLNLGLTHKHDDHVIKQLVTGEELRNQSDIADYRAMAFNLRAGYQATDAIKFGASLTRLNEASGFLGNQGSVYLNFDSGAVTDSLTLDASAEMSNSFPFLGRGLLLFFFEKLGSLPQAQRSICLLSLFRIDPTYLAIGTLIDHIHSVRRRVTKQQRRRIG